MKSRDEIQAITDQYEALINWRTSSPIAFDDFLDSLASLIDEQIQAARLDELDKAEAAIEVKSDNESYRSWTKHYQKRYAQLSPKPIEREQDSE